MDKDKVSQIELEDNSSINDEEVETSDFLVEEPVVDNELLAEMVKEGLFYGHKKSKTNPKMKPYILTNRNGVEIIDLVKTIKKLEEASDFIAQSVKAGKNIMWVAIQPAAQNSVKELAESFSYPMVINKWVGGMLTNFENIRKRVRHYTDLKTKKESGELKKYTKKEQAKIGREITKMDWLFSGVEDMSKVPDVMFMVNPKLHMTALKEAKIAKIPVVALVNTDTDPNLVDYPIPVNDGVKSSIDFVLKKIKKTIDTNKKEITLANNEEGKGVKSEEVVG